MSKFDFVIGYRAIKQELLEICDMMKNPGRLTKPSQQPPKGIALGLGLAGLVVVLGLIFALGFGVSKFLKGQTEETPQPISDNSGDLNVPEPAQTQSEQPQGQVVEMNNNTNALASTAGTKPTKKSDFVEVIVLGSSGSSISRTKIPRIFPICRKKHKISLNDGFTFRYRFGLRKRNESERFL